MRSSRLRALETRIGLLAPVEIGIVAAKLVPLFEDGKEIESQGSAGWCAANLESRPLWN